MTIKYCDHAMTNKYQIISHQPYSAVCIIYGQYVTLPQHFLSSFVACPPFLIGPRHFHCILGNNGQIMQIC